MVERVIDILHGPLETGLGEALGETLAALGDAALPMDEWDNILVMASARDAPTLRVVLSHLPSGFDFKAVTLARCVGSPTRTENVRILLDRGAPIMGPDGFAIKNGPFLLTRGPSFEEFEMLLARGADPCFDERGESALFNQRDPRCVDVLVQKYGLSPNDGSLLLGTPLQSARTAAAAVSLIRNGAVPEGLETFSLNYKDADFGNIADVVRAILSPHRRDEVQGTLWQLAELGVGWDYKKTLDAIRVVVSMGGDIHLSDGCRGSVLEYVESNNSAFAEAIKSISIPEYEQASS